jgi:DNA-binding transcriptional LysR family regulator
MSILLYIFVQQRTGMATDWDDYRMFLALARSGNLTAAARRLGVSHPTVARRVRDLEKALGVRLFDQLPDRFALTASGEELLADAEGMEQAAEAIYRRSMKLGDNAVRGTVRLWAGEAMIWFIARHLPRIRANLPYVELELVERHQFANLSRREADLLIHEKTSNAASLVGRRLGRVTYGVYAARQLYEQHSSEVALDELPWCGFDDIHSYMPGQAWIQHLIGETRRPAVRVNNWVILYEVVVTGAGLTVLPCYIGDADPRLRRFGPTIDSISIDQWLLVHRDLRYLPRIRAVMNALVQLYHDERDLIEGRLAQEPLVAPVARPA